MRTPEQTREHYEIERALADRLRSASREERLSLYSSLYDELFQRVPHHPGLTRQQSSSETADEVAFQLKLLRPFLSADTVFLEVGPGDCTLAVAVASFVRKVYALDVSTSREQVFPENFAFKRSNGVDIDVARASINVAYSNQLMEHLPPGRCPGSTSTNLRSPSSWWRVYLYHAESFIGPA